MKAGVLSIHTNRTWEKNFTSNLPSTSKAREDDIDGFPDTLDFETEWSD